MGTLIRLETGFWSCFARSPAAASGAVDCALGPEVTLPLASKDTLIGFLTIRYEWEALARTTTQGSMLTVAAAFPFKPIKLK